MKKLLLFAFAVFAFAACTQNDVEELSANRADVPETLTVGFEGGDTRIQLNEAQKTVWNAGDEVSVFYRSNANQKWQYQGETGERVGNLKRVDNILGTLQTTKTIVVYPYSENYWLNTDSYYIDATLPAVQHYAEESYGVGENLMVSQSEFTQFSLKSVCGWLKIQLTGNGERVQNITLRGNNEEQLAGLIYVNTATAESTLASEMGSADDNNAGGNLVFDDAIVTELTLDCGEGVELGEEAMSFYIAVPPQTFEQGITVDIVCDGYKPMTLTTTSELVIERNHIKPMESVAFAAETSAKPSFTLKSLSSVTAQAAGVQAVIGYKLENPVEGVNVEATVDVEWITINEIDTEKKRIYYSIQENDIREKRVGVITATYGEYGSFTVTVTQKGAEPKEEPVADPELTLKGEATKEFTAEGGNGEFAFELKNAVEGTELVATCEASWVSGVAVDAANSKVTYVVAANDTTEARETKVVLTYGELKVEVAVKQAAGESDEPTFKLKSLSSVNAPAAGADAVIGYKLENPVEGVKVEATADVEWITISEIDENKKRIYYRVQETDIREERVGVITATYGEYGSFTVTVTQKGDSGSEQTFTYNFVDINGTNVKGTYTGTLQNTNIM